MKKILEREVELLEEKKHLEIEADIKKDYFEKLNSARFISSSTWEKWKEWV